MTWCVGLLCLILNWGNFYKICCCKADLYIVARRFYTMWDGKKWMECFPWQSGSAAGFGEQRKRNATNKQTNKKNQTETFRWILLGWQKAMRSDFEFFRCCKAKSFKLKQLLHEELYNFLLDQAWNGWQTLGANGSWLDLWDFALISKTLGIKWVDSSHTS